MKIQIDTQAKTVTLIEDTCLNELNNILKKIFPEDYKDFKITRTLENNITYIPYYPYQPYTDNKITYWYDNSGTVPQLKPFFIN